MRVGEGERLRAKRIARSSCIAMVSGEGARLLVCVVFCRYQLVERRSEGYAGYLAASLPCRDARLRCERACLPATDTRERRERGSGRGLISDIQRKPRVRCVNVQETRESGADFVDRVQKDCLFAILTMLCT